jgi:predicted permease
MAAIVFEQIAIMFIILAVGVVCSKSGILTASVVERLSVLLLQVIGPIVIFISYQTDYSRTLLDGLLTSFGLSLLAMLIQITVTYLFIRKKRPDSEVEKLSTIYSNSGFFGIPLAWGLFGKEGVFYLTGYLTVHTFFFWTQGIIMISGSTNRKEIARKLLSPAIIGVLLGLACFVTGIRLPSMALDALELVGNMNTPLAMLVAGATLAQAGDIKSLGELRLYRTAAIKLLAIPIAVVFVFSFIPVDPMILLVIIMAAAAPSGASNTMMAIRFHKNSAYASRIFVITTLLSIATIVLMVAFAQRLGIVV